MFLEGASLCKYDKKIADSRVGTSYQGSPEHQEVLCLLEQVSAEVRATPNRKKRLEALRRMMTKGFFRPPLLVNEQGYRVQQVSAEGVEGEWVLSPQSDKNRRLLYLHGGSFISGCPQGHRVLTTELARVTGASVFALNYRLLPEYSRREQIHDCQMAYHWILENSPEDSSPVREFFVAGDSAGGNLALMLATWARDLGLRSADGVIALSPSVDMTFSSPTLKSNLNTDPMLGPSLEAILKLPHSFILLIVWIMHRIPPPNPLISPIFGDLSNLPSTLIQVSEAEMMLGDAQRYTNKARAAGSPVTLETWPDLVHVWHLFEPILPEAGEAIERIGQFVKHCVGNSGNTGSQT